MKCPICSSTKSRVIDSRPVDENNSIRRRRECLSCHLRFSTYEIIDVLNPIVIKKDGSIEMINVGQPAPQDPIEQITSIIERSPEIFGRIKAVFVKNDKEGDEENGEEIGETDAE